MRCGGCDSRQPLAGLGQHLLEQHCAELWHCGQCRKGPMSASELAVHCLVFGHSGLLLLCDPAPLRKALAACRLAPAAAAAVDQGDVTTIRSRSPSPQPSESSSLRLPGSLQTSSASSVSRQSQVSPPQPADEPGVLLTPDLLRPFLDTEELVVQPLAAGAFTPPSGIARSAQRPVKAEPLDLPELDSKADLEIIPGPTTPQTKKKIKKETIRSVKEEPRAAEEEYSDADSDIVELDSSPALKSIKPKVKTKPAPVEPRRKKLHPPPRNQNELHCG